MTLIKKDFDPYHPTELWVDESVKDYPVTNRIKSLYPDIPISLIDTTETFKAKVPESENVFYIMENKGKIFDHCPGTHGFVCCNYFVVSLIENCHLDCHYCYLQGYLNSKVTKISANTDAILTRLDHEIERFASQFVRIGTGELSDSLAYDHITGFSELLIEHFQKYENFILELKTKTNNINHLMKLPRKDHVIFAWSLNPQEWISLHEQKSASLASRIDAAVIAQEQGYMLAFHFDPIIIKSFEDIQLYEPVIRYLSEKVDPERIAYISLGGLRFPKELYEAMKDQDDRKSLTYGEIIKAPDGKFRYFRTLRENAYKKMLGWLREWDNEFPVYLCMEAPYIWEKVYGVIPKGSQSLNQVFKHRIQSIRKKGGVLLPS